MASLPARAFSWHVTSSGRVVLFWIVGQDDCASVMSRILPSEFNFKWFMNQDDIKASDFVEMTDDELESLMMMVKIDGKAFTPEKP